MARLFSLSWHSIQKSKHKRKMYSYIVYVVYDAVLPFIGWDIDQIPGDKTVETETTTTAQVMYCTVLAFRSGKQGK